MSAFPHISCDMHLGELEDLMAHPDLSVRKRALQAAFHKGRIDGIDTMADAYAKAIRPLAGSKESRQ